MCDKCENLLNVKKGDRAETMLYRGFFDESEPYLECMQQYMEVNRGYGWKTYAFIRQEFIIKDTGRGYGESIRIGYCPFCGRQLVESETLNEI